MEKDGIPTIRCETGDPYVCICSGGLKLEGERIVRFPTFTEATDSWLNALEEYKRGKTGILYWRTRPEHDQNAEGWAIYSRLVISDKPEIAVEISGEYYWNQALCPQD